MTNVSIENKDIFYKRRDINEFLREHPFVSDLYDATLQALYAQKQPQSEALRLFNQAYFICTLITEHGGDKYTILSLINDPDFEKDSYEYPLLGLNLMVVKCLLRVHQELLTFDSGILAWLKRVISNQVDSSPFRQVVKNYSGEFSKPLNFSGKYVEVPIEEKQNSDDPYCMLNRAQQLIKDASDKLCTNAEDKDKRIKELEELLRLEREKNNTLSMRVSALEESLPPTEDTIRIDSDDEIYNAINYLTIKDFACGRKEEESSVISNMLGKLALRGNLGRESVSKVSAVIEDIDNAHKPQPSQPQKTINCSKYVETEVNNDNKDSQVFNGKIDNSRFGK